MKYRRIKRNLYKILALLFILLGILALVQVWFELFSWDVFIKICISFAIITVILIVFLLIWIEKVEEDRLKEKDYID